MNRKNRRNILRTRGPQLGLLLIGALAAGELTALCSGLAEYRYRIEIEPASCQPVRGYAERFWDRNWQKYAGGFRDLERQKEYFFERQRGVVVEARPKRVWRRRWPAQEGPWSRSDLDDWSQLGKPPDFFHLPEIAACSALDSAELWVGTDDVPCCDAFPSGDLVCESPGGEPQPRLARLVDVRQGGRAALLREKVARGASGALLFVLLCWAFWRGWS